VLGTGKAEQGQAIASGRSRAERRTEAERRLLAAAVTLVSDRGTEGRRWQMSGRRQAIVAGCRAHYFGSKSDLIVAVASYISDGFANRLAQPRRRIRASNLCFTRSNRTSMAP